MVESRSKTQIAKENLDQLLRKLTVIVCQHCSELEEPAWLEIYRELVGAHESLMARHREIIDGRGVGDLVREEYAEYERQRKA